MPALLLAFGTAFAWLGRYILTLFAGELFRKVVMYLTFNIIMAFVVNTVTTKALGFSIFDIGNHVTTALGGIPQFGIFLLVEWGLLAYLFTILTAHMVKFFWRRSFGAMGGR